jgi:ATP-dependent DNA helicase RecG
LPELDTFIKTTISNRRPIPVTALQEEQVTDYPDWATRELLMNAICHRDYTSNGPIQFYQYDDRIEIMNHGGLYGRANVENFPNVNDYRNIVVAEAMKVLGFVNRYSRGVLRVQKELKANENGDAIYDFSYQTAVMVTENKSPRAERMIKEAIANGLLMEDGQKRSNLAESTDEKQTDLSVLEEKQTQKQTNLADFDFPTLLVKNVYETIKMNRKAKYSWLADNLGVSERTIQRAIDELKRLGYISSVHSKNKGEWQLLK